MPVISLRRNLFHLLAGVSLGGGFILAMLATLFPYMWVEITWIRYAVWIWLACVFSLGFLIIKRLLGEDPVPGEHARIGRGFDHRVDRRQRMSYSHDVMNKQARYAQAKARRDAAEREGVKVEFGPQRTALDSNPDPETLKPAPPIED